MATWIKTDGTTTEVHPKDGRAFTLEELQAFVGGYIELVRIDGERNLWLNEEGKLDGLPLNVKATKLTHGIIAEWDFIVGDVLVATPEEFRRW